MEKCQQLLHSLANGVASANEGGQKNSGGKYEIDVKTISARKYENNVTAAISHVFNIYFILFALIVIFYMIFIYLIIYICIYFIFILYFLGEHLFWPMRARCSP